MYVNYTMGVVMSIEHERLDGENTDDTLEQYGVWVKKSPTENSADEMTQITDTDFGDDFDLDESDFDTNNLEIFSEDENVDEDVGISFGDDIEMKDDEVIEDESENTTLTTDELLNITSGMSIDDDDGTESDSLDVDFDSFMEVGDTTSMDDFSTEVASDDSDGIDPDLNSDFDLMGEDSSQSISSIDVGEDDLSVFDDSSDMDISFDEFMEEGSAIKEDEDNSPIDMDVSFEDTSESTVFEDIIDETDYSMDIEENDEINLGEEISLDDIPSSTDNTVYADSFDEEESVQDFDINIEPREDTQAQSSAKVSDSNDMLSKIVEELSNLRQEMSQFKSELAKIKTDGGQAPAKGEATPEGGFFSDYEGDDTIALSGDELNNILTSADFTIDDEAHEEESQASEEVNKEVNEEVVITNEIEENNDSVIDEDEFNVDSLDDDYFSSSDNDLVIEDKELVEPSLDDIDFDIDSEDSLPDEIDVPVIEDLVVDSSPVNFFDDEEEQDDISDDSMKHLQEDPAEEALDEDTIIDDSDFIEADDELSDDIKDSDIVDGFYEPDINDPVSSVFSSDQWETDIADDSSTTINESGSIGGNMQEEIKSVLSYMDRLLESLPEDKISEFAQSEYFDRYKKLFTDLGIA